MDDRPFTLGELEIEAQRLEDQEDVGEQDRGIDAQPLGRGDGHLRRQLGPLAQLQERDPARMARYSGMYRPACLISQIGVTSDGSRRQALRNGDAPSWVAT